MPTETEIKAQREYEETMRLTRMEFAQHWPAIWKIVGADNRVLMPPAHHAAWLAFCAAKGVK